MGQISCCVFDLETTNLSADFGIVLCGVIKPADGDPLVFRGDAHKTWARRRSDDSPVLKDLVNELAKYDIWCAHNGAKFDVPFLRTRLLRHGLPPLPTRKLLDPLQLARNKLRMSFNSLAQVANLLGCNTKTDVRSETWLAAALDGCKASMGYIVEHCVQDVYTLETVVGKLKDYSTALNSWGNGV